MLRKILTLDELPTNPQCKVIQTFDDYIIIDAGEPEYSEDDEIIYDPESVGDPATWADVTDPKAFRYVVIGGRVYSWGGFGGAKRLWITDGGFLAVAKYDIFRVNDKPKANIRKLIAPTVDALRIDGIVISVDGRSSPNTEYRSYYNDQVYKLGDIILRSETGYEKTIGEIDYGSEEDIEEMY